MAGTMLWADGTAGSAPAGPSAACSWAYCVGVSNGPTGFSGPVTLVKSRLAWSFLVTAASGAGSCHTGVLNRKMRLVGLAADCGKYLVSNAWPAAESLPAGGAVLAPKPAAGWPKTAIPSPPKKTPPPGRVGPGGRP